MGLENNPQSQEIIAPVAGTENAGGISAEVASQFCACVERYQPKTPLERVQESLDKHLEVTPIFPEMYCPEVGANTNVQGTVAPGEEIPPHEQKEKDPVGMEKKSDFSPDAKEPQTEPDEIVDASQDAVGNQMWADHAAVTQNGRLGAAASVCAVLREAGVKVDELSINGLEDSLLQQGWQRVPLEDAQPGDVIVGWREHPNNGNTGIVGEDGSVYSNDSATGQWRREATAEQWQVGGAQGYEQVYVLRAP